MNDYVMLDDLIEHMNFVNVTSDVDTSDKKVTLAEINRPALQLTGFYSRFIKERVQIIGVVEFDYLEGIGVDRAVKSFDRLCASGVPCIIFTNNKKPSEALKSAATRNDVPLLVSEQSTAAVSSEILRWLGEELAPMISVHGVLVDVYGEGVLITGESGIGKSETALELIKRGHRLVSDDAVEIRKISDVTLIGSAPEITRHMIELRGIGIIDVKTLFGIESVEDRHKIDLVIRLTDWDKDKEYERLGMDYEYTEYLGNKVVCHTIPIRPGRNLAIIVETAAINHRQRRMGYNAAEELYRRVQENLNNKRKNM